MPAAGTPDMGEKSLSDIVLNGHCLYSLPFGDSQNIEKIGRGNESTVNPVGKEYSIGIFDDFFYFAEYLSHVHFHDNDVMHSGAALSDQVAGEGPQGLQFQ
jgi:hypothetical protein